MPSLIEAPTVIAAAGTTPKRNEEYVGRVTTGSSAALAGAGSTRS